MIDRGVPMAQSDVQARLESRDLYDSTREASPLTCAEDAFAIDTTGMTIDEVVDAIIGLVEARR